MSLVSQGGSCLGVPLSRLDSASSLSDRSNFGAHVARGVERDSLRLSVTVAGALVLLYSPTTGAASSPSFQISASTFDVAGGTASSASHQVQSCVGSEIAGTAGSSSFRVDSGCGVTLGFVSNPVVLQEAVPVPALSSTTAILLAVTLATIALMQVRQRRVSAIR